MKNTLDGAHAILVTRDGEVLLVQKGAKYIYNPHNAGKVSMFGGGIEPNETPENALVRELSEELELDIHNKQITPLGSYQKTISEDEASCTVHVFVVRDIDPTTLFLHKGIDEGADAQDDNSAIVQSSVEVLLARTDITRITRLALEDFALLQT